MLSRFTKTLLSTSVLSLLASPIAAAAPGGEKEHHSFVEVPNAMTGSLGLVRVWGQPGMPYSLWFSSVEEKFDLGSGIILDVNPIRQLTTGLFLERNFNEYGFDDLEFPVDPTWAGSRLSIQIVTAFTGYGQNSIQWDDSIYSIDVSNLARATFQAPNTFAEAVGVRGGTSFRSVATQNFTFPTDVRLIAGSAQGLQTFTPWDQNCIENVKLFDSLALDSTSPLFYDIYFTTGGALGSPFVNASRDTHFVYFNEKFANPGPQMLEPRAGHMSIQLWDGYVMVLGGVGGVDPNSKVPLQTQYLNAVHDTTEIYNAYNNSFYYGPQLPIPLAFANIIQLDGSKYLISGGLTTNNGKFEVSRHTWIFDTDSMTFSESYNMSERRMFHEVVIGDDGEVLIFGGVNDDGLFEFNLQPTDVEHTRLYPLASTEIGLWSYYSDDVEFESAFEMTIPRAFCTVTAVEYDNYLVAGGTSTPFTLLGIPGLNPGGETPAGTVSTEFLDFYDYTQAPGPDMIHPRVGATAVRSPMDSRIIMMGGGPDVIELYQPIWD